MRFEEMYKGQKAFVKISIDSIDCFAELKKQKECQNFIHMSFFIDFTQHEVLICGTKDS